MKKLFAIFCAIFLTPVFSAQAWIGGPFSNNTFFGEQGDDGVYEAIATGPNALGIYRIVVGNNFDGVFTTRPGVSTAPTTITGVGQTIVDVPLIASGNVVLGAMGRTTNHMWFYAGVAYIGMSLGTASSISATVVGIGSAQRAADLIPRLGVAPADVSTISSSFRATMQRSGRFLPATAFSGTGRATVTGPGANPPPFNFLVFGSKVSSRITFGF